MDNERREYPLRVTYNPANYRLELILAGVVLDSRETDGYRNFSDWSADDMVQNFAADLAKMVADWRAGSETRLNATAEQ